MPKCCVSSSSAYFRQNGISGIINNGSGDMYAYYTLNGCTAVVAVKPPGTVVVGEFRVTKHSIYFRFLQAPIAVVADGYACYRELHEE